MPGKSRTKSRTSSTGPSGKASLLPIISQPATGTIINNPNKGFGVQSIDAVLIASIVPPVEKFFFCDFSLFDRKLSFASLPFCIFLYLGFFCCNSIVIFSLDCLKK